MQKGIPTIFLAAAILATGPTVAAEPRLVVVSWDGAADWVVDRLLAEGTLPHLAALRARGAAAEHSLASFPSKTAVSHAALWTGCWSDCNGITANKVLPPPGSGHTVLEKRRGFDFDALTAEPLFLTAARAGRKVAVLSATHHYPAPPLAAELERAAVPAGRFLSFSGFTGRIARGKMFGHRDLRDGSGEWGRSPRREGRALELEMTVGESTFYALLYDDPADPAAGLDTVLVRQGSRKAKRAAAEATLKPRPAGMPAGWSRPFRVRQGELSGHTFFRLFALGADGSELALYQRQASGLDGIHRPVELAAYLAAYPGFHDDPFWRYQDGDFGTTLMAGGDGTAERRALEIVAHDTTLLQGGTRFALERWAPDVLFHYSPMSDSAGHSWLGVLDPASPAHDPALAAKLWPFYAGVFRQLDAWLGEIVRRSPRETVIALVTDHGMAGTDRDFHVNRALELAGLLGRDGEGKIDLAATRVVASDGDFFVRVNDRRYQGGIVAEGERQGLIAAASYSLLAAVDPDTGARPIARVFRRSELAELGADCPHCGDLYLDPAPGYYPTRRLSDRLVTSQGPGGEGNHGYRPERREMHAIFYLAGPGVKAGVTVPAIRQIDVAPTLARLLGIPAPAQAAGRVVEELLVSP